MHAVEEKCAQSRAMRRTAYRLERVGQIGRHGSPNGSMPGGLYNRLLAQATGQMMSVFQVAGSGSAAGSLR